MIKMDRFLETCVHHKATEAWLVPGSPPVIRVDRQLRQVQAEVLDLSNVESMIAAAAGSDWNRATQNGPVEWDFTYGRGAQFRVTVLGGGATCVGHLRRIGNPQVEAGSLDTLN